MLIAIFIFVASLFGGTDALLERIEGSVSDPDRQASALEVIERVARLEDQLAKQIAITSEALREVHGNYGATREDYLAALKPLEDARRQVGEQLLAARTELKGLVTRDEWREVFPVD